MRKRLFIAPLLIFFVLGLMATFAKSADVSRMKKDELKAMLDNPNVVIIDVRANADWVKSNLKVKGAVREDAKKVNSWMEKYSKDKTLVFYCS